MEPGGAGMLNLSPDPILPASLPSLDDVHAARKRLAGRIVRTPLVRVRSAKLESAWPELEVYLKLENLQITGSFEDRGATNALLCCAEEKSPPSRVVTASTGNFAQSLARSACALHMPLSVLAPQRLSNQKMKGLQAYGADVRHLGSEEFFEAIMRQNVTEGARFIRPAGSADVLAGIASVGLEILDDLPDVDAIAVAFGSGGLACSIGLVLKALKPETKLIACEAATSTPLYNAMQVGQPTMCRHQPTFIDGIGLASVLPDIWPHLTEFIDRSVRVSLSAVANAIRFMAVHMNVVAEGAGAVPVAAALQGECGTKGKVVCVVSGGNIDMDVLADILQGVVPFESAGSSQQAPPSTSERVETSI